MQRLAQENSDLRSVIADLHQQIAAIDAENAIITESLSFFRRQIGSVAPPPDSAITALVTPETA
jgi:hypothetical protein